MKASRSKPFTIGGHKPEKKDARCPVQKPSQISGQQKQSWQPLLRQRRCPKRSSVSIAGEKGFILSKSGAGKRSPCKVFSAVPSGKNSCVKRARQTRNKSKNSNASYAIKKRRWPKPLHYWCCEKSWMRSGRTTTGTTNPGPGAQGND